MISKIYIGASWDHIKVVGEGIGERVTEDEDGTGSRDSKAAYWTLQCDCGKEFNIWDKDWRGKKFVRDCGCRLAAKDGEKVVIVLSAPALCRRRLQQYAIDNGLSLSRAAVELIYKGLGVK